MTDRIVVGRIVKPHGLRGEVVVAMLTDRPERLAPGAVLFASRPHADRTFEIETSRPHQGRALVKFAGVPDRTAAEGLRGIELEAEPTGEEEVGETYDVSELVGMRVRTDDGRDLGEVTNLIELPDAAEYDLLEIERRDGSTWLLPAVGEWVAVDEDEHGREFLVVTDPPEGLIDGEPVEVRPS